MSLTLHSMAMDTFVPMLGTLSALLDKSTEQMKAKGLAPDSLVEARLAPDMFSLAKQVQSACFSARNAAARLAGQEPPASEDNEKTLAELKTCIRRTLDYVGSIPSSAYEGAENRRVGFPLGNDFVLEMNGLQYLRDWALPNFYFHVVTAYDILRNQGVQIGKQDYLAHAGYAIRPKTS